MANCKSCSANLPTHTNICRYCGTTNPIDLEGVQNYTISHQDSLRFCPHCTVPMRTLNLDKDGDFYIEQCPECYGFFFDPGELETLLDDTIPITRIDVNKLEKSNYKRVDFHKRIKYIHCPICNELMQRLNYGYKSGVVMDKCKAHGVWLDSGELRHLMEWKSAGGEALDKQYKEDEKKMREAREERKKSRNSIDQHTKSNTYMQPSSVNLLLKIFRIT